MAEHFVEKEFAEDWQAKLQLAVKEMLDDDVIKHTIGSAHTKNTPLRFVKAYKEIFQGCLIHPESLLSTVFPSHGYNEMVYVKDIKFFSVCAHHLLPFFGTADFAYIPNKHIVGLSKIPRFIHCLAQRPQVQEKLSDEIAQVFYHYLDPIGCGVHLKAYHMCMCMRGVKETMAYTETTALRGSFLEGAKQEFLISVSSNKAVF